MKELICVVDTDPKIVELIKIATAELCKDFNHELVHKTSMRELEQFRVEDKLNENIYTLLILSLETLDPVITPDYLKGLQTKFKTNLVITAFQDLLKPLKKTETWPIENLIYKPFDSAILKEHLRFSFIRGEVVKTTAVHSSKDENQIEKIKRHEFLRVSDFGFMIETDSDYNLLEPFKFYHPYFLDQKKSSVWAKAVSRLYLDATSVYEFVFCTPTPGMITKLRLTGSESKTKLKNVDWAGLEANKPLSNPQIIIQLNDDGDFDRLKDFFNRKFPIASLVEFPKTAQKEKLSCDLFIYENELSNEQLKALFEKIPICFRISNESFKSRADIIKAMSTETLRLPKPIDRSYLSRMMMSFFPGCTEKEPNPVQWFTSMDTALYSELITVGQLSEAAFTYRTETALERGHSLEFIFSQDDETDLKPVQGKVQYVETVPDAEKKLTHQIVFFGIRDEFLKKIRLWMLQNHINQKKSGS